MAAEAEDYPQKEAKAEAEAFATDEHGITRKEVEEELATET